MNQIEKTEQNERMQKRQILIDEDFELDRFFEPAASNKIYVKSLNLHEIKNEILQDYTSDFELNGLMIIGPIEHKTNIRFEIMEDFESYMNAIEIDYDNEDVTYTGYIYEMITPQFNVVKRSGYRKGTNFLRKIVEYRGQNCYIPSSGMCFIKCMKYFTNKGFTVDFIIFIRTEQRRSNAMTTLDHSVENILSISVVLMER